jgi:hypothetical protein
VTPNEWAAAIAGVIATLTAVYSVLKMLIKSIVYELRPNSGQSMKDQITRIEARIDRLYEIMTRES